MSTASKPAFAGRSNDILWAAVGILGVLAMGYFYVAPQMTELKTARATTQAREKDAAALETQITQVNQIAQQLNSQQSALQQLALAAPSSSAYDQLLIALQAIASESGVVLSTVQPASGNTTAGQQVNVTISLKGSYGGMHLFLENTAKNIRPLTITNLSLTSAADVTGASLLNATLIVTAAQAIVPKATTPSPTGAAQ